MILRLGDRRPVFEGDGHFVADNASIIGSVRLKAGASVWFGAIIRGDNDLIEIGRMSNIQDGAVLHTDAGLRLIVGDGVTVGHRAMLHGCTIGDNVLIGIGSIILNHACIGKNSVVGAYSLVTENKSFPDGVLIMGVPAKVARELTDAELAMIGTSAAAYIEKGGVYRDQLAACEPLQE